jgi:choline-sulfatase
VLACPKGGPAAARRDAALWRVPLVYPPRSDSDLNLLLVTVDTLRRDHLSLYGCPRRTSPNVDRLAARGLAFREAETVQSATWPALTSLHTSLYPSTHGVIENGEPMSEGELTLARLLHDRGYSTAAFLTNMKRGRHPGFTRLRLARGATQADADADAAEAAIDHLRLVRNRTFFVWLHLLSPHAAYSPPAPYDSAFTTPGRSRVVPEIATLNAIRAGRAPALSAEDVAHVVALYDGEVAYVDSLVGRVLDALRDLGLERSTLVVFTADHGEDLHEHNRYFYHSPSIYGSSMRIPLVMALPGVLPEGVLTDQPASLIDVAPTVLGLLRLPRPSAFQGKNLLPGRALPRVPVDDVTYGETAGRIFSLRTGRWRFVYNPERLTPPAPGGPYPIREAELYDERSDPREQKDLAGERKDLVRAFTRDLVAWRRQLGRRPAPSRQVDPDTLEELKALGYVADGG